MKLSLFSKATFVAIAFYPWLAHAHDEAALERTVSLSYTARQTAQNDQGEIRLFAIQDGLNAADMQSALSARIKKAIDLVKAHDSEKSVKLTTEQVHLSPHYDKVGQISGWQGQATLLLESADMAKLGSLAGLLSPYLSVQSVNWRLSDQHKAQLRQTAEVQAIDGFKAEAGIVARQFGFANWDIVDISINATNDAPPYPMPRLMMAAKAAPMTTESMPIESGEGEISVIVQGRIALKP